VVVFVAFVLSEQSGDAVGSRRRRDRESKR
jgi:hypothetical protein